MIITVSGKKKTTLEYGGDRISLYQAVIDAGEAIYAPCGGNGKCGKCRVIASGDLSEPSGRERETLGDEIWHGVRLACMTYAVGDTEIILQNVTAEVEDEITADTSGADGVAVDIGTTTVALKYIKNGRVAGSAKALNPQAAHGADVISRIGFAEQGGLDTLRGEITECIDAMMREAGVPSGAERVIVGNTVMLHLFTGLDPSGIGRAPFLPASYFGEFIGNDYLPACVSGYVGADVISAAIASGMNESERSMLCDMGTNGEIIFNDHGKYKACSAAAGPALEGAGIKCGMMASAGAVDHVDVVNGEIVCHVIGDGMAVGICGSGLIDAVSALLTLGVIEADGYLEDDYHLTENVYITPSDIRALQLAKGAVRAGIETVLNDGEIDRFYISGGLGGGLNVDSCVKIGLIPERLSKNTVYIGNGALSGAVMMLADGKVREAARELAEMTEYIELSSDPGFTDRFMKYIEF